MTSSPTSTPDSARPKPPEHPRPPASRPRGPGAGARINAGKSTASHKFVTIFATGPPHFVDSVKVMSASDSPGLLAGNPPFAAGCPG